MSSNDSPMHRVARTLQDAHELVARNWPGRHASAVTLRAYYDYAAQLYDQVANRDSNHRNEAKYLAEQHRDTARRYGAQLDASTSGAEDATGAGAGVDAPPAPVYSTIPLPTKERNSSGEQR